MVKKENWEKQKHSMKQKKILNFYNSCCRIKEKFGDHNTKTYASKRE